MLSQKTRITELLITNYSLLITHYKLLITNYSLLTCSSHSCKLFDPAITDNDTSIIDSGIPLWSVCARRRKMSLQGEPLVRCIQKIVWDLAQPLC